MDKTGSTSFVKGALILTLAGLVSKLLSAGYRIPLQNLTGDFGFYIYQQIYPFLGIALMFALYGFPTAVAKLVQKENGHLSLTGFYLPVFIILFVINTFISTLLLLGNDAIAIMMGDSHLAPAIQLTAILFLFIPITSLLRGTFQGNMQMTPVALSQVGEQFIRVIIIIMGAIMIMDMDHPYGIGMAAVIAAILGIVLATGILMIFMKWMQPWTKVKRAVPWGYMVKVILLLGFIAALNHMILLLMQLADAFTLIPNLVDYGWNLEAARIKKGILDRGVPLIQLGMVIGSSFALAIIPAISMKDLHHHPNQTNGYIRTSLMCSMYLSIGATIGLILLFPEVNTALFQSNDETGSLRVLSIAIFLSSTAITTCSILQGLGFVKRTAIFILLAFMTKCLLNLLLVPVWGLMGASLATISSLLGLCLYAFSSLRNKAPTLKLTQHINWQALIYAICGMTGFLLICKRLLPYTILSSRWLLIGYLFTLVILGAMIYIILLVRIGAFTRKQLTMLPFTNLLHKIMKAGNINEQ